MAETATRYSTVSIILHWTIAALILANVFVGGAMEDAGEADKMRVFEFHKSIGITVLLLSVGRIGWRLMNPSPALPPTTPGWERIAARLTHTAFYVLMFAMPLAGWAAVSAGSDGSMATIYGVLPWADLPLANSKETGEFLGGVHEILVKIMYGVLALHVLGALKHHFVARDDVMARMAPIFRRKPH